jgi:hypothetical protein
MAFLEGGRYMAKLKYPKSLKIIPFPGIEGGYYIISFRELDKANYIEANQSFLYVSEIGDKAVEWEPEYGPITKLDRCDKNHPDAVEHYFFPYCTGFGNWSQLGVENSHLPELLLEGDYKGLFEVLKSWL